MKVKESPQPLFLKGNRVFKILIITATLVGLMFSSLYIYGIKSEPYKIATNYIKQSEEIRKTLGSLISCRLAIFGYSVRYSGPNGIANYEIVVKGEKRNASVYINMKKSVGIWEILKANMITEDGETISLIKADN